MHHFRLLVFAILANFGPVSSATFENVSLVLNWRSGTNDQKTVTIRRDNELRNYVGQFGEVLIHHQNIPKLTKNSVSNLPKVTHLDLASCRIRKIEPGAFRFLPELTDLNLSGNLLEELENGIFDQVGFRTLYLENNRIKRIGDWVFRNLKMEYLFIDDNKISEWRSEWFRGTPLTSISMRNNQIQSFPRLAFEFLWHLNPQKDVILENLILSGNKLRQIDFDAFSGVKVILSLDLQNNSLTYLEPGIFDSVEVIDRIQLSNNKLAYLYQENFRKTRISELDLYDNLLECVPIEIFNVSDLEYLNIEKNPINCDCYHSWRIWKSKNKKPKIGGWERLENECKSPSGAQK
ncbi:Connectin-like Protein [Tribolium castaneum]|uniref:Connectin-like Protein n=1 Tax=Tribolium castaneum TaxID=7070 RepID=D6WEN2_TRICA|nr:Connectin-like Protein [Tribolium castaneum]